MPKVGVGSTTPRPVPLICLVSGEALVLLGGWWAAPVVAVLVYTVDIKAALRRNGSSAAVNFPGAGTLDVPKSPRAAIAPMAPLPMA